MPVNMSKEEERALHRDERQREKQVRRRIFYPILVLFVLAVGLVLSFTVFFHLSKAEVRGYSIYSENEVVSVSGVKDGDNLFLINRGKVKEHITEKLPYIGDVQVKIALPNKLIITVYETSVKCAVETKSGYVLLDENAKVLGTASSKDEIYANAVLEGGKALSEEDPPAETEGKSEEKAEGQTEETLEEKPSQTKPEKPKYVLAHKDFVVLKGAKVKEATPGQTVKFSKEKALSVYTDIMALFIENEITGITDLDLSDPYNIVMKYENRIDVKVGSITNLKDKMAFAAEVIKDQDQVGPNAEGVIDLTIDKKAYFSPKTEPKTTTTTTAAGEVTETTAPTTTAPTEPPTDANGKKIASFTTAPTTTTQPPETTTKKP